MKKVVLVDIDETICITPDNPRVYEDSVPILENIQKINKLYDQGNTVIYWTARGSRSKIDWYDLTKNQLEKWGAKHHELWCNKPYFDLLIDDRTKKIEDLE